MDLNVPDWLVPGTPVVLYTIGGVGGRSVKRSTIAKVGKKTFTVADADEPRFRIATRDVHGGGTWGWTRTVVPLNSDTGRKELAGARRRNQISRATTAVSEWRREPTRKNRLAAIERLQAIDDDEEPG